MICNKIFDIVKTKKLDEECRDNMHNNEINYVNFKKCLEFFVCYLNYANSNFQDKNIKGYNEYLLKFEKSGPLLKQGYEYRGDKIQAYMFGFDFITKNKIQITISVDAKIY